MKKLVLSAYAFAGLILLANISKAQTANSSPGADSLKYKEYYGVYKMTDNPYVQTMKAYFKNGSFYGLADGYPETVLNMVSPDEFKDVNMGSSIIFTRKDSIVTGVMVSVQGQEFTGVKVNMDSLTYQDYYGTYKMKDGQPTESIKVFFKNGNLIGQADGYPESKLTKVKENEFTENAYGSTIKFIRQNNKVTGIKISAQGQEMEGVK